MPVDRPDPTRKIREADDPDDEPVRVEADPAWRDTLRYDTVKRDDPRDGLPIRNEGMTGREITIAALCLIGLCVLILAMGWSGNG